MSAVRPTRSGLTRRPRRTKKNRNRCNGSNNTSHPTRCGENEKVRSAREPRPFPQFAARKGGIYPLVNHPFSSLSGCSVQKGPRVNPRDPRHIAGNPPCMRVARFFNAYFTSITLSSHISGALYPRKFTTVAATLERPNFPPALTV